jgi:hypothetical protein
LSVGPYFQSSTSIEANSSPVPAVKPT